MQPSEEKDLQNLLDHLEQKRQSDEAFERRFSLLELDEKVEMLMLVAESIELPPDMVKDRDLGGIEGDLYSFIREAFERNFPDESFGVERRR